MPDELARRALYDWLNSHEGEGLTALYEHYFPPSTVPFTREELRRVFVQEWHAGRIDLTHDRRVVSGSEATP